MGLSSRNGSPMRSRRSVAVERRVNCEWPKDVPRYAWRRLEDQPREYQMAMAHLRGQLDRHEAIFGRPRGR